MWVILDLVSSYFGLTVKDKNIVKNGHALQIDRHQYMLSFPAPTYHERIEAQLQLHEWLRDKVSPTELAELIGQ